MAIYHCNISVVTRGRGASVVASSAYISRSSLKSEREEKTYNYTRAHQHEKLMEDLGVALPGYAPARFADRTTLWNEVERVEKRSDAQLARRIECALPDELPVREKIALAKNIVDDRVSAGHVVDACVHCNVNGTTDTCTC